MKCIILLTIFTVVAADYYKVKDDVDMATLATKPEGLKAYVDCFLEKGPCTELTAMYRSLIPESTKNACSQCTDKLKHQYWLFLEGIKKSLPESYKELRQLYDPQNKYFDGLENELSKYSELN